MMLFLYVFLYLSCHHFVVYSDLCTGGWMHGVSFSKDGSRLAWVSHDSCITVADAANDNRYGV